MKHISTFTQVTLSQTAKQPCRIFSTLVLGGILFLGAGITLPNTVVAAPDPLQETTLAANANLPESVANAVLQDASKRSGLPISQLNIVQAQKQTWPNGCLGLGGPGVFCTQALVPGWQVTVEGGQQSLVYRTDESGSRVKLDTAASQTSSSSTPLRYLAINVGNVAVTCASSEFDILSGLKARRFQESPPGASWFVECT